MAVVSVESTYNVDADALWRHVVRYDTLQTLMNTGAVKVRLPENEERAGDDIALTFRLWDCFPIGRWRIRVLERDDARRRLRSEESGIFVRRWAHVIEISERGPSRARQIDTIEIDAGWLTPLIARFARKEYAARARARAHLLSGW